MNGGGGGARPVGPRPLGPPPGAPRSAPPRYRPPAPGQRGAPRPTAILRPGAYPHGPGYPPPRAPPPPGGRGPPRPGPPARTPGRLATRPAAGSRWAEAPRV